MKRAAVLALLAACGGGQRAPRTTPRQVEVLVNEQLAGARGVGRLIADFDVSPARQVVVADAERTYVVGWGGLAPVDTLPGADSIAYTLDGVLLVVRGTQLLYLDEAGVLQPYCALPNAGMALAAGSADTVYLFDRSVDVSSHGLYELRPGRQVAKILESPHPIESVARGGDRLFMASAGIVFDVTPGAKMRVIARLDGSSIRSVAAEAGRLYFSDGKAVYALAEDGIVLVTATAGGWLRVRDRALLVLDPAKRLLVRLAIRQAR